MTTTTLESYVYGNWVAGNGKASPLVDPSTEEQVAQADSTGVDFGRAREYGIAAGGALRALTFAQRGAALRTLAKAIHEHRDELIGLGMRNAGNTRSDAKFDIDGAAGTLGAYADLGESLGDAKWFTDGEPIALGRSSRVSGQHVLVPRVGVAVHINAYNFPAWGLAEKAAVALLAGMPVIAKPATSTALMSWRMAQVLVATGALPDGALQFIAGSTGDLVERLGTQDVLAFTGSGATGTMLKSKPNVIANAVRVNIEADSLNAAVLGRDVERGDEHYEFFIADVVRDVVQKCGQKCTAIRRVFVPRAMMDAVCEDLADRLARTRTGSPTSDAVTMGPLATASQLRDVLGGIERLANDGASIVCGGAQRIDGAGAPSGKGYFVAPTLLRIDDGRTASVVHEHEVFGPCASVIAYDTDDEAVAMVARAGGGLVSSVYTADRAIAATVALGLAPFHGRVAIVNAKVSGAWLGPGTVLPQLVHGGPGRAGGGEELGGVRGMGLYLQRTALQGYGPLLESITAQGKRYG